MPTWTEGQAPLGHKPTQKLAEQGLVGDTGPQHRRAMEKAREEKEKGHEGPEPKPSSRLPKSANSEIYGGCGAIKGADGKYRCPD
jgi:hypothetical protein